ncbi:MAG: hypothetical protein QXI32_05620 [Candidatus Bathyarchaeia archaeon]
MPGIGDPIAALVSIQIMAMWSYIYFGGSVVYDYIQDLYVASAVAYSAVMAYESLLTTGWNPLVTKGEWHYIIPIILGFLLFAIISRKWAWLQRWPSAILLGCGIGLGMASFAYADVTQQLVSAWDLGLKHGLVFEWLVIIIGMALTFWFFVYTVPHKGPGVMPTVLDRLADIGKAFVMIYITSKYASTVMYRLTLFIGNLQRILWDWLGFHAPIFG